MALAAACKFNTLLTIKIGDFVATNLHKPLLSYQSASCPIFPKMNFYKLIFIDLSKCYYSKNIDFHATDAILGLETYNISSYFIGRSNPDEVLPSKIQPFFGIISKTNVLSSGFYSPVEALTLARDNEFGDVVVLELLLRSTEGIKRV